MSEHYFTESPTSDAKTRELSLELAGHQVTVETASGTFSPTRLDLGTAVLLRHLPAPEPGDLLDRSRTSSTRTVCFHPDAELEDCDVM